MTQRSLLGRSARRWVSVALATIVGGAALVGCAAPADVGPFADATATLRSAVAESGRTVEVQLRDLAAKAEPASRSRVQDQADLLAKEWAERIKVMDSVVEYTDGLRAIVEAGNHGAESAKAVAAGVAGVAQSAGLAMPATSAVGTVVDAAAFVYAQIARARAAATLEESLTLTQPALERIAVYVRADMKRLDDVLVIVGDDAAQRVRLDEKYKGLKAYREFLAESRREIWSKLQSAGRLTEEQAQQLALLDDQLAATEGLAGELAEEMGAAQERTRAQRELLAAGLEAMDRWAEAHAQLVRAVKERRSVNQESLIEAAVELRALIRKVREQ